MKRTVFTILVAGLVVSQTAVLYRHQRLRAEVQAHAATHSEAAIVDRAALNREKAAYLEATSLPRALVPEETQSPMATQFLLYLIFDRFGCTDCVWKTLKSLKVHAAPIQELGGDVIIVADSSSAVELRRLRNALTVSFPIIFTENVAGLFPDSIYWEPPVLLVYDQSLHKIVYARFEDGGDEDREAFLEKAIALYGHQP